MDGCQWYISLQESECGNPVVRVVHYIPTRHNTVKTLKEPLPVCSIHASHIDKLFARLRIEGKKHA